MPSVVDVASCEACGGPHVLCLARAAVTGDRDYRFTYPNSGHTVVFRMFAWNDVVEQCPPGSVDMWPAGL